MASAHPRTRPVLLVDSNGKKASSLASELGCEWGTEWREAVKRKDIDAVVIATPNSLLAPVSIAALRGGKHVLCEKPMALTPEWAERMVREARRAKRILKVGYTLRHHPAIARAKELLAGGVIGKPMYARCLYGHGGRPGYHRDWRFARRLSGGGELIDQGVHVIDLSRWFFGEIENVFAATAAFFWPVSPLEDNIFAILSSGAGYTIQFHASCTQWKNRFNFEIYGADGYLTVDGLGGSYGIERLVLGRRNPRHSAPREKVWRFTDGLRPWRNEWEAFLDSLRSVPSNIADGEDGLMVLKIAHALYRSSRKRRVIKL